eukprot:3621626-Prymnesium_polylepis.1
MWSGTASGATGARRGPFGQAPVQTVGCPSKDNSWMPVQTFGCARPNRPRRAPVAPDGVPEITFWALM